MFVLFTVHGACASQASYLRSGVQVCGRSQETYALPLRPGVLRTGNEAKQAEFSGRRTERVWGSSLELNLISAQSTPVTRRGIIIGHDTRIISSEFLRRTTTSRDLATFQELTNEVEPGVTHSTWFHRPRSRAASVIGPASLARPISHLGKWSLARDLPLSSPLWHARDRPSSAHTSACESHHP
jgi:hypothetical protein